MNCRNFTNTTAYLVIGKKTNKIDLKLNLMDLVPQTAGPMLI